MSEHQEINSPRSKASDTEIITKLPDWGANEPAFDIAGDMDRIISDAVDQEATEKLAAAQSFIDSLDKAADKGIFLTSDGSTYDSESLHSDLDNLVAWTKESEEERKDDNPYTYFTRNGGLRNGIFTLMSNPDMAASFVTALELSKFEREKKTLSHESVGAAALHGADIEPVEADEEILDDEPRVETILESKQLEADIQALLGTVPDIEHNQAGLFFYATARSDAEILRALDRIDAKVRALGIHDRYRTLFADLQNARKKEGLL